MKRLFWLAVGVTVGVLVVRKLSQRADQFTPQGLAESVQGLGRQIKAFGEEVRAGMEAREEELRDALALGDEPHPNGHAGLDAEAAQRLHSNPDAHWREGR
jgi:hypothetical protein